MYRSNTSLRNTHIELYIIFHRFLEKTTEPDMPFTYNVKMVRVCCQFIIILLIVFHGNARHVMSFQLIGDLLDV